MVFNLVACNDEDDDDDKEDEKKTEEETTEEVKELDDETREYIELIRKNVEEVAKYREEFEDMMDDLEYDNLKDLKKDIKELKKLEEELDELPKKAEYEDATDTYSAAKYFVSEVRELYEDVYSLAEFNGAVLESIDEMMGSLDSLGMDNEDDINALYVEWTGMIKEWKKLECPDYISHCFDYIVQEFDKGSAIIESMYYGYYYEDILRAYSSMYLFEKIVESGTSDSCDELDEITLEQIEHMADIANDNLKITEDEILDNCDAIENLKNVEEYTYQTDESEPEITYSYVEEIYPAVYNHMNSVVTLKAACEYGECDVLVTVEIDGFTKEFEQKYTIDDRITVIDIKPEATADEIDLTSMKNRQLTITVKDADDGTVYLKENQKVEVMSLYDWPSFDEYGSESYYTILSWLEPESDEIKELKRLAAEIVPEIGYTGTTSSQLVGYQGAADIEEAYTIVMEQVLAIQIAMARMGVVYNNSAFSLSTSDNYIQRVTTPSNTLDSKSGICIETSLVVASALQAAGMNAMLVITPGHCQVAVEIFETGEYFLVETTVLTEDIPDVYTVSDYMIAYFTPDEWVRFTELNEDAGYCYYIECNMAKPLGYIPFSN